MPLMHLLASGRRFLPLGDGRFLELSDTLRKRLNSLRHVAEPHRGRLRLCGLSAGIVQGLIDDVLSAQVSEGWQRQVERLQQMAAFDAGVPSTLQAHLRTYQEEGYKWLCRLTHWGLGACLADDMGLGKTIQSLALLLQRAPGGPALVVAPASVCFNWQQETVRYAPSLRLALYATEERDALLSSAGAYDVVVVTYTLLQINSSAFEKVDWHTVILDEGQAIKNATSKRFEAACALHAAARVVLTGTPVENHLGELWALVHFLNPGLLGTLESFNARFANPIEQGRDVSARTTLRQLIAPFVLRRRKADVLEDLPSCTETVLNVPLSNDEASGYEALRRVAMERLGTEENQVRILAEIMRLRRYCCHPALVTGDYSIPSSKLEAFEEVLDELRDNGHKALVFSQFVDHLTIVRRRLEDMGIPYQYLDGGTPLKERQKAVESFQAGAGEVFLISLKAGGVGLNLTAADYVIHLDPWWNPAVEDQATMRAHRIGQQRPVTVYRLITQGTIEEKIVALHRDKRELADQVLEGTDAGGRLSAEELLRLLR
ncbi:MAG TPA: DEAD/DEAH box helicase [Candidatus Xenobia bacterium]|jgi:SNF2 family DNA or RNA helicase